MTDFLLLGTPSFANILFRLNLHLENIIKIDSCLLVDYSSSLFKN